MPKMTIMIGIQASGKSSFCKAKLQECKRINLDELHTRNKENVAICDAIAMLEGKSVSYKNELLFSRGINFDKLPSWQKRGIGIWKEQYEKEGFNPITKENEKAIRSRLHVEYELPLGEEYANLVASFIE